MRHNKTQRPNKKMNPKQKKYEKALTKYANLQKKRKAAGEKVNALGSKRLKEEEAFAAKMEKKYGAKLRKLMTSYEGANADVTAQHTLTYRAGKEAGVDMAQLLKDLKPNYESSAS